MLAAGCASPKEAQFTDSDWVSQTTTGKGSYDRGDYRRAADAFGRAEQRARALDDADALAVAAVNRAISLLAESKAEESLAGVEEALADSRVSKPRQMELKVAGARAWAALGKPEDALAQVDEVLKLDPPSALRAQALLAKSSAELAKEDVSAATKALTDGLSAKEWSALPWTLQAESAAQRAKIAAADKRPAEAAGLQDEAAALWKKAGRLPDMARALAAAGRQAQAAGDLAGACDRYYRAARSLWAQGLQPEAVRTLEEGVECAEVLKDEAVAKRMAKLFVTFKDEKRLSE
jgi:tetratricopeptide (TPR) repeat protein